MKTALENTGGLSRKLTIDVPADKVTSAFDKVYKLIQKNANIKGFRKGKAPIQTVKSLYSDRAKQDVLEELISEAYSNALTEHSLRPATQPMVNFNNLDESKEFQFTAEFEVRPEIKLKKVTGLSIEKELLEINEEKVESILTQIRESRSQLVPVFEDRPAKLGDTVNIDFVGTVDGKPLDGATLNDYKLELGSNAFIPGFEEGLIGVNVNGRKELNLKFPDDYGHADIAGKPVHFLVTVKAILKKDMPELTDEFIKSLGGFQSLEDLKKTIREDITQQESKRINEDLKNRVLHALVEANPIEVPKSLRDKQRDFLIRDTESKLRQQGMNDNDVENYKQKWNADFEKTAEFMVQSSFLIEKLSEEQKLTASQAEFNAKLEGYAKSSGIELTKLKEFYAGDNDRRHQVYYQITEDKVVDYLIQNANILDVEAKKLKKG